MDIMRPNPAVKRRFEYAAHHAHAWDGPQLVFDFVEQWSELLLPVAREPRIDPDQIPAMGIESEVLVLAIAQALAEHCRCAKQDERHSRLHDHQRPLRPNRS